MWIVLSRAALGAIALLVTLAAIGFGYERVMSAADAQTFPPPGRMLSVDGHAMQINCNGTGSPTVLMNAGLGGWSMDWSQVQPAVARSSRVCAYDRPGMGWSSPGPEPRDAQRAVDELQTLLASTNPAPFYDDPVPADLSGRVSDLMEVMLDSSRLAIAHLSSNGRVEKVARSGHYIQFDRPDSVIQAIEAGLEAR